MSLTLEPAARQDLPPQSWVLGPWVPPGWGSMVALYSPPLIPHVLVSEWVGRRPEAVWRWASTLQPLESWLPPGLKAPGLKFTVNLRRYFEGGPLGDMQTR